MRIFRSLSLSLLLIIAFSVGILAADVELTWYYCCAQQDRADMFNRWARDFEAQNPGVKINAVYPASAGVGNSYYEKLSVAIASDTAPDVVWLGNTLWRYADLLMPLDDLYKSDSSLQEIIPGMIAAHRWKSQLIAIPYGANTHVFFYNKDVMATVGTKMPSNWTWEQAIDIFKKLGADTNGDGLADRWGLAFSETAHPLTYGSNVYSNDMRKVMIDNPATIAGLQLATDLINSKYGMGTYYNLSSPAYRDAFINGSLAMNTKGVFEVPTVRTQAQFAWDITTFPILNVDGKQYQTSYYSQEAWSILKSTKHPDIAKKFLLFIMKNERMGEFARLGAVIPTQPSVAVRYFLNVSQPANMKAFTDALQWWKMPETQHPGGVGINTFATWGQIMRGEIPATAGVPELARQLQLRIDEWWANYK